MGQHVPGFAHPWDNALASAECIIIQVTRVARPAGTTTITEMLSLKDAK